MEGDFGFQRRFCAVKCESVVMEGDRNRGGRFVCHRRLCTVKGEHVSHRRRYVL